MKYKKPYIIYPTEKECIAKIDWCGMFKEEKRSNKITYDLTRKDKKYNL